MFLSDVMNPENFPNRLRQMPKVFKEFPNFTHMEKGVYSQSVHLRVSIETLAHFLLQQRVCGYENNRGGTPLNFKKVQRWFGKEGEGLMIENLGEFPLGDYWDEEGNLKLPTHHHRCALLGYMYWMASDKIWNQVKNESVSVRIFDKEKFVKIYVTADDEDRQPKGGYLNNPDMVMGSIIFCGENSKSRLAKMLSIPARELVSSKSGYMQPLASLLYGLHYRTSKNAKGKVINLLENQASCYGCRTKVGKLIKMPLQDNEKIFVVKNENLEQIASAIEDYVVFLNHYNSLIAEQEHSGINTDVQKKIVDNTGFFAYFMHDRCVFQELHSNPKLIAERLAYHCNGPEGLGEAISFLWNGDNIAMCKRADKITEILRRPVRRKVS